MRGLFFASDGRIALFWRLFIAFVGTLLIYLIFDLAAGLFLYLGLHINYSYLNNIYSPAYNMDLRVVGCYSIAYVLIAVGTVWFLHWFRRKVDGRSPAGLAWTGLGGQWRGILLGVLIGASVPLLAVLIGSTSGLFTLRIARLSWWGLIIIILFNVIQSFQWNCWLERDRRDAALARDSLFCSCPSCACRPDFLGKTAHQLEWPPHREWGDG